MSARETQDPKVIAREMFAPEPVHANAHILAEPMQEDTISIRDSRHYTLEALAEDEFEPAHIFPCLARVEAANLVRVLRQLEIIAKRHAPRIAFKTRGKILFLELAAILAVEAEGNYVSIRDRCNPYLLRESISAMAEKLKPYGFIRIHRSVIVNISAVEELQALSTGEYRLRIKGGKEYLVTRTYKESLRDLAELWVGSERLCS